MRPIEIGRTGLRARRDPRPGRPRPSEAPLPSVAWAERPFAVVTCPLESPIRYAGLRRDPPFAFPAKRFSLTRSPAKV